MEPARGTKVGRQNFQDIYALTPMQEGMLSLYLKDPQSDLNVEQLCLQVSGKIEVETFGRAWNLVVQANEVLRTVFRWEHVNRPVQIVLKERTLKPDYHDLSNKDESRKAQLLREYRSLERKKRFDLHEVPFRVSLCKVEAERYEMIIGHHHILFDGWSYGILLKEFLDAYGEHSAPPVKTPFKEYVKWLQARDTGEQKKRTGRKTRQAIEVEHFDCPFPEEIDDRARRFAEAQKITVASLLYAAWGMLLQKYQATPGVLFDTTVSGRTAKLKGIEEMVGLFINTLPLRVQTRPGETIAELFQRTNRALPAREQYENTDGVSEGLFDSLVVVENYPLASRLLRKGGRLSFDSYSINESSTYDLTVIITVFDGIKAGFSYDARLFDEETIGRVSRHFIKIVDESLGAPGTEVAALHLVPGEEIEKLRIDLNNRQRSLSAKSDVDVEYLAPRDEVERKLVEIWSEVLQVARDKISIDADFFDFGGHSLTAGLLAAKVYQLFAVRLPWAEMFRRPTIRELAQYIKKSEKNRYLPIRPAEKRAYYTVSSAQRRLFMLHQLEPESTAYNGLLSMRLEGNLKPGAMESSLGYLIDRHESLRTAFVLLAQGPVQKIRDTVDVSIEYMENQATHSPEDLIRSFIRPFDLTKAPLVRIGLITVGETTNMLMVDMHHIIIDGISTDILLNEFLSLYGGGELPPLKIQYKDFSEWQNERLESGKLKEQEEYWLKYFSGELPVLKMPTDYPRDVVQTFAGEKIGVTLDEGLKGKLHTFMKRSGTTLYMILLAGLNLILNKYTGQQDIVIGSIVAGRDHPDLENMVGLLVETIGLRSYPAGDKTFTEFLQEVKTGTLQAYENQGYPFRELMNRVIVKKDFSRNPLFDVLLNVRKRERLEFESDGLRLIPFEFGPGGSRVDLMLDVVESQEGIKLETEYCTTLFKRETMLRFVRHYVHILDRVVDDPDVPLSRIKMVGDIGKQSGHNHESRKELRADFNF